jgi:hypothetical protein
MQNVSFRDVKKALKELKGLDIAEAALLNPQYDAMVADILFGLGMDTNKPMKVVAQIHRDLDNNVGIGFRYHGRMRLDDEWRSGPLCGVMERIAATSYEDTSLTLELCNLVGTSVDFSNGQDTPYTDKDFPPSQLSDTWMRDVKNLAAMEELIVAVRGKQQEV